jgi:hypothetical protein
MGHTNTSRGRRVIVTLKDGTTIIDRFVRRPKNNRWIELRYHGRIARSLVSSVADLKGAVDEKRLGKKPR